MNKKSQQVIKLFTLVLLLAMACTGVAFADAVAEVTSATPERWDIELGEHYAMFDDMVPGTYTAADCDDDGSVKFYCQCKTCLNENKTFELTGENTGDKYLEDFELNLLKDGHKQAKENCAITTEPTCTEDGEMTFYGCDVCGKDTTWTAPVKETGHNPVLKSYTYATCTADGVATYECSNCGEPSTIVGEPAPEGYAVNNSEYTGKAMGHLWKTNDDAIEGWGDDVFFKIIGSTCGEQGEFVTYKICERCTAKPFTAAEEPADACGYEEIVSVHSKFWDVIDHAAEFDKVIKPVLETVAADRKAGKTEKEINAYWYGVAAAWDADADDIYEAYQVQMPDAQPGMLGWVCDVAIEVKEATCLEPGYIKLDCTNENCPFTYEITLNKTGHKLFVAERDHLAPTCMEDGAVLVHCEWCDFEEVAEIEAPGFHDYETEGDFNHYYSQETYFGTVFTDDIEEIATCHPYTVYTYCFGHSVRVEVEDMTVLAMVFCCEDGYDFETGELCECVKVEEVTEDLAKHTKNENWEVYVPATCCTDGYYMSYCTECGYVFTDVIPATGCEMVPVITKQVTCVDQGEIVWMCKCKLVDEDGEQVYDDCCCAADCANCKDDVIEAVPAPGHKWYEAEEAATCTKPSKKIKICTVCGKDESTTGDIAHNIGDWAPGKKLPEGWAYKAPTCTGTGLFTFQCVDCHQWQYNVVLSATGHAWDNAKSAHHDKYVVLYQGVKEEYKGEKFESHQDANCIQDEIYFRKCHDCGLVDNVVESGKTGHTYYRIEAENKFVANFVMTKDPTCTEEGEANYNCLVCGAVDTLVLPKLGHNIVTVWDAEERKYISSCEKLYMYSSVEPTALEGQDKLEWLMRTVFVNYADFEPEVFTKLVMGMAYRWEQQDVDYIPGIGHGWVADIKTNAPEYTVTKEGNIVTINVKEAAATIEKPMICVTWSYTMANGTSFSYTRVIEAYEFGDEYKSASYKIGRGYMPGATLDAIYVDVVDTEDAEMMDIFEVAEISYGFGQF